MSLLLHLSDLHLANAPDEDAVGDYKVEAVPETDRVTRVRLLRYTLKALTDWLAVNNTSLDGIIITGDITTRGHPEGFQKLPELLEALGDALPPPERIVIVPGNHDVAWGTTPGSEARYRAFVEGARALGYVTPLLDGIDYDSDTPDPAADPLLIGRDFVIVAINSADMCGVIEPFQAGATAQFDRLVTEGAISDELQGEIRRVRTYDMPRISPRQMAALANLLDHVPPDRVRIAALHHHLASVRQEEEVKPFEAIVNLGAFNAFLGEASIDAIAHGHKHTPNVQTLALTGANSEQRLAVLASCGTIGGTVGTGNEIAKLIRIDSSLPTLRRIEILSVPAVSSGSKLRTKISKIYDQPTWRPTGATPITVIGGTTVTDVHEQLRELAQRASRTPTRDLMCIVDDGTTALAPPATYPWAEHSTTPLPAWFDDIVSWWQDSTQDNGKSFTHGQRLRDWSGGHGRNQFDAIVRILGTDPGTSRGIAVLVNPETDDITDKKVTFPSFSLLHLWIQDGSLHCSAFFRKQEMTYWWPVNAAELARVQAEALQRLRSSDEHITAGAIRTYASEAVFSDQLPKVNVPLIDRQYWQDAATLRVLAVAVADSDMPGRNEDIDRLISLMDDWVPVDEMPPTDGAPVPVRGLSTLAEMLDALASRYPQSSAREVSELLREMDEANESYLSQRDTGDSVRAYTRWRTRQGQKLIRLRQLLAPSPDRT